MARLLFIFGTRPEAIKLCPVIRYFRKHAPDWETRVAVTAQHRELLDQVLEVFDVNPDDDLNLMAPGQTLFQSTSRILSGLQPVFESRRPDLAFVQGDTTTTLCGAMAAFYSGVPVAHVEAGLRTGDMREPFPEEMNRAVAGRIASLHLAATEWARQNLLREGVTESSIHVTGNTGIDAVLHVNEQFESGALPERIWPWIDPNRRLILVTAHRRESFGAGFEKICEAIAALARRSDVQLAYPVHPNPNVAGPVRKFLSSLPNIHLIEPLSYVPFIDLMRRAYFLLTDSGGVQEEGPSLGKPILVMRDKTERPEAVSAGTVKLVGTDPDRILAGAAALLDDPAEYDRRKRVHNPYGDGRASERIFNVTRSFLSK